MHFVSHQTENHYREAHQLKVTLIALIKFCLPKQDHLTGMSWHYYKSCNGGLPNCMCIKDLYKY